ncbi:hypothetical protein JF66_14995 [Cryobacterium sp. MLB-32]|nr:hypothetical protein JF66_14995 [Cryobacterium sp. MLB-32]
MEAVGLESLPGVPEQPDRITVVAIAARNMVPFMGSTMLFSSGTRVPGNLTVGDTSSIQLPLLR